MIMKLLFIVSFFLASFVALGTAKGCVHCLIETCGPCGTHCEADQFSRECESCVPSCVECITDCKVRYFFLTFPYNRNSVAVLLLKYKFPTYVSKCHVIFAA